MAVYPVHFCPDNPQVLCPGRYFHVHKRFDPLAIAEGMESTADAADSFHDLDHLVMIPDFRKLFQSSMHITQLRDSFYDNLVING
jgi:hypothetical protein